jgi:predicted nucleic acid-binding Zn ribbon protein
MHCTNCGKALSDGVKFCANCGNSLNDPKPIAPKTSGNSCFIVVLVVGGLLILAALVPQKDIADSNDSGSIGTISNRPSVHVSTIAEAQTVSRNLINEAGQSCDQVTSLSPIGNIQSGGTVHRAACSNGGQYVVILSDDDQLRFLSSCAVFAASTGERC